MRFFKLFLIPLFSIFFLTGFLEAGYFQQLEEISVFEGDRHGKFEGDLIAILSDGSAWKIHPKDRTMFQDWNIHDVINAEVRTSFYFFKREHKFALYNHNRNESARVMLLQPAQDSPIIIATEVYKAGTKLVPYTWTDGNGFTHTSYYTKDIYEKKLLLSDNTVWVIKDHKKFDHIVLGQQVYMGINRHKIGFSFFLISGTEREAKWAWVHPVI